MNIVVILYSKIDKYIIRGGKKSILLPITVCKHPSKYGGQCGQHYQPLHKGYHKSIQVNDHP